MSSSMKASENLLPKGFEDLEPYLDWALPHQLERAQKRQRSTMAECRVFYDALTPRIEGLITYMEGFPRSAELDTAHNRLFMLGLAYMDVAIPIDSGWKDPINPGSLPPNRLNIIERR